MAVESEESSSILNTAEVKLDTSQNNRNVNEVQQSTMGTNDLFDEHVEVTVVSQLEVEVEVDMMKEPEIFPVSLEGDDDSYISNDRDNKNSNSESRSSTSSCSVIVNIRVSDSQDTIIQNTIEENNVVSVKSQLENNKTDKFPISCVWSALYEDSSVITFTESELC